jgi:ABC-2 type transport system ATP-binding protein
VAAPAIRTIGLTKYFDSVVAVEDLSLDVEHGEIYGFLGANGAGKTTTIRLLMDLLRPTRGTAMVLGIDCHRASLEARRQIGYLPGELPIYPDMTAGGYLNFLGALDGRPVPREYLGSLLKRFDVSAVDLRRPLRQQSHGMKRKIGVIQALMSRAPLIVLDEPTSGLDPLMVQAFRETLEDLRRQRDTTVFLSSHVLAEVESTCDHIGLIRGGRLVTAGTIDEIRRVSPRRVRVELNALPTGEIPPLPGATIVSRTGRELVLEVRGPLGPVLGALGPLGIHDVHVEPFKLEDYIVKFYTPAVN